MEEPHIRLFSDGLLSKWGFNDGDDPEHWCDYCDEHGINWASTSWHPVLIGLVRRFLLPALDQRVEVIEIQTIHNPIRAVTVDGANVEDAWYEVEPPVRLTPEYVDIPMAEVARLALSVA